MIDFKQPANLKDTRYLLAILGTLIILLAIPLTVVTVLQTRETTFRAAAETRPNDDAFRWGYQWNLEKIRAPAAWDITTGSSDVVIAVLGTGVDQDHPDLAAKLVPGYNTLNNSTNTDDDDIGYGWGTMIAGIAAAVTNNNLGIAGVSWGASIMPVKVCGSGGIDVDCAVSDLAEGIVWAADHGADVIHVAKAYQQTSFQVQSAVDYAVSRGARVPGEKDAIVVSPAGNLPWTILYPAAYGNVVAVGVTDQSDTIYAGGSGRGEALDVTAPGVSILTTAKAGDYHYLSGTHPAAAHVSGVLALLLSKGVTPANAVQAIYDSAINVDSGVPVAGRDDDTYGHGRLDACGALNAAGFTCPVTGGDTLAPTVNITNPTGGAIISGTVNVDVNATDN